jgi:heptaprenyl diphosphate synthase
LKGEWPADVAALDEWLRGFICQPHSELLRAGAVCPHVPDALSQRRLLLAHVNIQADPGTDKRELLVQNLLRIGPAFKAATSDEEFSLDCLIVTLGGLAKHEWRYVVDGAHRLVKPHVLRLKLMVGGFYPTNNRPSRRNPLFFPMQAPVPLVAFRHMVRRDRHTLRESDLYLSIYETFYPTRGQASATTPSAPKRP